MSPHNIQWVAVNIIKENKFPLQSNCLPLIVQYSCDISGKSSDFRLTNKSLLYLTPHTVQELKPSKAKVDEGTER